MGQSRCEEVGRIFRTWLALSSDPEVLALLSLVRQTLRDRGYEVTIEIGQKEG